MLERLIPNDTQFFEMFTALAERVTRAARMVQQLFSEPQKLAEYTAQIKQVEHEADQLTYEVNQRLNKSFITPFDREDIYLLASRLDDVIDLLDGTARRATMFRITEAREPAKRLASVVVRCGENIEAAVASIKKTKVVIERGAAIKRLEEEGDAIYHEAVGGLFRGGADALEVIKWKELYDTLERAIDQCEDVANALESIAIKNA